MAKFPCRFEGCRVAAESGSLEDLFVTVVKKAIQVSLPILCSYFALHVDRTFRSLVRYLKYVAGSYGATVESDPDSLRLVSVRDVRDALAFSSNGNCS